MILVDYSQVAISSILVQVTRNREKATEDLIRHTILNILRSYKRKFGNKYGELVIVCDDKHFWRVNVFPYYKANRKKTREASPVDWNYLFNSLHMVRDELKEYFPYKVLRVEHAEADDIIGVLCKYRDPKEKVLILSGDKDFKQLQKFDNVDQYSPITKQWIREDAPETYLKEHIIRGDSSDGVPNFLSADDTFVAGGRQTPITSKRLCGWLNTNPEDFEKETMVRGFKRNQQLVDLDYVPDDIVTQALDCFKEDNTNGRKKLLNYFIKYRLRNLMDSITEF